MSVGICTDRQGESSSSAPAEKNDDGKAVLEAFKRFGERYCIDKALEAAGKIPPGEVKWKACRYVSRWFAGDGRIDAALRILKIIPRFSHIENDLALEIIGNDSMKKCLIFEAIGRDAADAGDFDQAIATAYALRTKEECHRRLRTHIFGQLVKVGNISRAIAVVSEIPNENLRTQLLQETFEELMAAGKFSDAFKVAMAISIRSERQGALKKLSLQFDLDDLFGQAMICAEAFLPTYLNILEDLAALNKINKVFEAVVKVFDIIEKVDPNRDREAKFHEKKNLSRMKIILDEFNPTGSILIKVCETLVQSDKFNQVAKAAELIPDSEIQKNLLIDIPRTLAAGGEIDRAIIAGEKLLKEGPQEKFFIELLRTLAAAGEIDRAIIIAKKILKEEPQEKFIADISKELAMAGEIHRAITMVRENLAFFLQPEVFQEISEGLAAAGKVDEAFRVATEIWAEKEMRHAVLKDLSSQAELAPFFDRKLILAETISNRNEKLRAYFSILEDLIACGKLDKTDVVIEKIYELTKIYYEDCELEDFAKRACYILAEIGKVNQAIEFARIIDHPVTRSQLLLTICEILAEANQSAQALSVLREFGNNPVDRSKALMDILKALTTRGQVDEVIEIAKVVSDPERCQLEFGEILQGVLSIVRALAEAGYFEKAREVIQGIRYEGQKTNAFSILSKELAKAHRFDEALETVQRTPEGNTKSEILCLISKEFATAHRFDEALKIADMISDENEKAEAFCVISEKCAEKGLVDRAIELMKVTSKASSERKFTALRAILKASQTVDHLDLVARYTKALPFPEDQDILFMGLFRRFIAMGRIDKALEISRDVFEPFSLSEISEKLKALGKMDEAKEIDQRILAQKN